MLQYIDKNNVKLKNTASNTAGKHLRDHSHPQKRQKITRNYKPFLCDPRRTNRPLAIERNQKLGAQVSVYVKVPHDIPQILGCLWNLNSIDTG